MIINGETQIIGFFGSTYEQSKMYILYNTAFEELKLNYVYLPFRVDNLEKAVDGVRHLGIKALGVTIPYKVDIIKYLDDLDEDARRIGAVNVVVNREGKLIGGNTDGVGAIRALKEKTDLKGKNVIILGAGGAGRALAFALYDEGANLTILNRRLEKAKDLATSISSEIKFGDLANFDVLKNTDILINTTPVGMAGTDSEGESLIPSEYLDSNMIVMDLITKPKETRLISDALAKQATVVYGYRMLLWQGVEKFKMYTRVEPPIDVMERSMERSK